MSVLARWRQVLAAAGAGESKAKALIRAVTADVESGRLAELQRLPSQRQAARMLGISGQTVTNAYQELERQGLIHCEVGRGTYVAKRVAKHLTRYILDAEAAQTVDLSTARMLHTPRHDQIWRDTCCALGTESEQPWLTASRPIAGLVPHRETACDWIDRHGLPVAPGQLLLTNGATQAVYLALATVAGHGDLVACDSLTDHGIIGAAQALGFTLRGLDSDPYGIRPDDFNDLCSNHRVTALVCTPNLNNPTASLMPENRRKAIADIAVRHGVYVIEDDACGSLLGAGTYIPLGRHIPDLAFYCTTLTKSVMTALRVGMLAAPEHLFARTERLLRTHSWMSSTILCEIAMRWIRAGQAEELAALQRERVNARQAQVAHTLKDYLLGWHPASLIAWLAVPPHWAAPALVQHLRDAHVTVTLADPFIVPGCAAPAAIRIAIGAPCSEAQFEQALHRIARSLAHHP